MEKIERCSLDVDLDRTSLLHVLVETKVQSHMFEEHPKEESLDAHVV